MSTESEYPQSALSVDEIEVINKITQRLGKPHWTLVCYEPPEKENDMPKYFTCSMIGGDFNNVKHLHDIIAEMWGGLNEKLTCPHKKKSN